MAFALIPKASTSGRDAVMKSREKYFGGLILGPLDSRLFGRRRPTTSGGLRLPQPLSACAHLTAVSIVRASRTSRPPNLADQTHPGCGGKASRRRGTVPEMAGADLAAGPAFWGFRHAHSPPFHGRRSFALRGHRVQD